MSRRCAGRARRHRPSSSRLSLAAPAVARADGEDELVALINARRAEPRDCTGKQRRRRPARSRRRRSSRRSTATTSARARQGALRGRLSARRARRRSSSPAPRSADDAARQIEQHYCASLLDRRYSDIGVARSGTTWRINLARPLIAEGPRRLARGRAGGAAPRQRGAQPARGTCGDRSASRRRRRSPGTIRSPSRRSRTAATWRSATTSTTPTAAGATVGRSARRAAATAGASSARTSPPGRARRGRSSPAGWRARGTAPTSWSRDFAEMGAAYAIEPRSAMEIYWTQVFGAR